MKFKKFVPAAVVFFVFLAINALLLKVKILPIIGTDKSFPASVAFGPSLGGVLGPFLGFGAVLLSLSWNELSKHGVETLLSISTITLVGLGLPMAMASLYFGSKSRWVAFIPLIAMLLFVVHPVGREVWYYSLYWLIPIIAVFMKRYRLIPLSIGAAFVDHCIGSVLYLYGMNIPASAWNAVLFITPIERLSFGLGIAVSYLALFNLLKYTNEFVNKTLNVDWDLLLFAGVERKPLGLLGSNYQ